jgi:hypothetical protein
MDAMDETRRIQFGGKIEGLQRMCRIGTRGGKKTKSAEGGWEEGMEERWFRWR